MAPLTFVTTDEIRSRFSAAMSDMYRQEVPQYGVLLDLVKDVNAALLTTDGSLRAQVDACGDDDRLLVERHGAIRLGTADELRIVRRIFAVMGMQPVGYYDLSAAGVPVHATAFRPVVDRSLAINPFRVFTSLLRIELIEDEDLRATATHLLSKRKIFTTRALELLELYDVKGGLTSEQADAFVSEVRETFRWHSEATVSAHTYRELHEAHRLIADVVCFKGPHINHLTPRTLDIDRVQAQMPLRGISPKEVVEGPPRRKVPILLRQTSFKALDERIAFVGGDGTSPGRHTARFGEIEQRGMALTEKGRALYDDLLLRARNADVSETANGDYSIILARTFTDFPDDLDSIRRAGLGFFRYSLTPRGEAAAGLGHEAREVESLIAEGIVRADPITYEDFLPVSAAGIFQSNLGGATRPTYATNSAKSAFEAALGANVIDEFGLYGQAEKTSLEAIRRALEGVSHQ